MARLVLARDSDAVRPVVRAARRRSARSALSRRSRSTRGRCSTTRGTASGIAGATSTTGPRSDLRRARNARSTRSRSPGRSCRAEELLVGRSARWTRSAGCSSGGRRRVIQLLDPPFDASPVDPGYIKAYVPGIRENGGQYTHAAVWTAMAIAELGHGDEAVELFHMLNPINRSRTMRGREPIQGGALRRRRRHLHPSRCTSAVADGPGTRGRPRGSTGSGSSTSSASSGTERRSRSRPAYRPGGPDSRSPGASERPRWRSRSRTPILGPAPSGSPRWMGSRWIRPPSPSSTTDSAMNCVS